MPAIVVDASVASAWCFPDEQTPYTEAAFIAVRSSATDAVAPRLWAYEVRNSLLMGLRRGRISEPQISDFFLSLADLGIRLTDPDYDEVFVLARLHGLTFYDAAYLNIALAENFPIATLDKQL